MRVMTMNAVESMLSVECTNATGTGDGGSDPLTTSANAGAVVPGRMCGFGPYAIANTFA